MASTIKPDNFDLEYDTIIYADCPNNGIWNIVTTNYSSPYPSFLAITTFSASANNGLNAVASFIVEGSNPADILLDWDDGTIQSFYMSSNRLSVGTSHTYNQPGTYTVKLTVQNDEDYIERSIDLIVYGPLTIDSFNIIVNSSNPNYGRIAQISLSNNDPNSTTTTINWGDGIINNSTYHTYTQEGSYNVSVTIQSRGQTVSQNYSGNPVIIHISNPPTGGSINYYQHTEDYGT